MRIGCLQFAPQVGDVNNNLNRADAVLNRTEPEDLDLLVLPEMAFSGKSLLCLRPPRHWVGGCGHGRAKAALVWKLAPIDGESPLTLAKDTISSRCQRSLLSWNTPARVLAHCGPGLLPSSTIVRSLPGTQRRLTLDCDGQRTRSTTTRRSSSTRTARPLPTIGRRIYI